MNWVNAALLSSAILGVVSIIDSHLLSKRLPSFRSYMLLLGTVHISCGILVLYLFPLPEGIGLAPILLALASGVIRTGGLGIMLYNLRREDVSRVVPITYSYPIFVAMMAVPLLGETLSYLEWIAIFIVVAGAIIISAERSPAKQGEGMGKLFLLLFVSSLLFAVAATATKYVLNYMSFWNVFSLTAFCMSGSFLLVSIRPHVLRQIKEMKRRSSSLALLIFNESIAPIGMILSFWAIERGPVSLVSTIIGTRPAFVAIYSIALSYILPKFLLRSASGGILALRLVATAMIVVGICIINMN